MNWEYSRQNRCELFGQLCLRAMQSRLNWQIIRNKKDNFRKAFGDWSIEKIVNYTKQDITQLMQDKGIARNNLKIRAII